MHNIAEIIWIEDLCLDGFDSLSFKYDVTELTTSLKPAIALNLLKDHHNVIFFDPDIYICHSIDYIINAMTDFPIVLTPHYTTPQASGIELTNSDIGMMRFGSFNLGFFAVSDSRESIDFLEWWDTRCRDLCYFETQFGLSTDQKWVSIAPCFFPKLHISFHLGLNVSFWNLHEREVLYDKVNDCFSVNNDYNLIFFHFSSYDEMRPHHLTTRTSIDTTTQLDLKTLIDTYHEKHEKYKKLLSATDKHYSYDYMSDGSYISPVLRRAYASIIGEISGDHYPFEASGLIGDFARRNKLVAKNNAKYKSANSKNLANHKFMHSFIIFCMRFVLKLIGPVHFSNLSRLFVYLSSYRQVDKLWKL